MLQSMRELGKSMIFKILMGLLVISFGIWGIGDIFRGNPQQRTVAKSGNISISVQELEHEFQRSFPEAKSVFGPELTIQQARQVGVLDRALTVLTEQAVFEQETKRAGIKVNDQEILNVIAKQNQLRDKDGKFNTATWQRLLQQNGMTERSFMDRQERDEARHQLFDVFVKSAKAPDLVINDLFKARGQKRILDVITVDNASMKLTTAPTDDELNDFYTKHIKEFTAPEYRAITIAKLSASNAADDIAISDEDLKRAYNDKQAEMILPEQRDLVQVVLQNEDEAKQLAKAAEAKGSDLAKLAKSKGLDAVILNRVDEKTVLPELFTTVFAMDERQISQPVKTTLGWHIVQVKKIYSGGKQTFEEAKEKLRETMKLEQSVDAITRNVNALDDALAAGKSLEEIATGTKLQLSKIPALDAFGNDNKDQPIAKLPAQKDLLRYVFSQNAGEISQVIEDKTTQGTDYIVIRTDEITPSHPIPLAEIKAKVLSAWQAETRAHLAAIKAEEITKNLREGKPINGVAMRKSKPISVLGNLDETLPPAANANILKMRLKDIITTSSETQQFVLRLAEIIPADAKQDEKAYRTVADDFSDKLPFDLVEEYSKQLKIRFPVSVNADLLETLRKQGS